MRSAINKKIIILILPVLITLSELLFSQDNNMPINLEIVMEMAGANNLTIIEYKNLQEIALAEQANAREWWLPDIYAGTTIHQLSGSVMNTDGTILPDINRNNFSAGIGLNAKWNFSEGIFKAKASDYKTGAIKYQSQAERNKVILKVIQTYYDLLAAQLYFQSYMDLVTLANNIVNQISIQVENGLRYESEFLLAKSNYYHLRVMMLNAQTDYAKSSSSMINLLNIEPTANIVCIDTVLMPLSLIQEKNLSTSFDTSYQNLPEFKSFELTLKSIYEERKTSTTGLLFPEVHIGTYSSYFGKAFSPLFPSNQINAALIWKIPLDRISYAGIYKQYNARIVLQETKMEKVKAKINAEILLSMDQIKISKEQIKIASEGSQLAEQAMIQSIKRQQLGTVRPFEILQAQEVYIKSRLDYLNSVVSFNKAQYKLYVLMGNNL